MKKIRYNYYYNGRAVSKEHFEREFGKNWKRRMVRDQWGNYSYGYFSACRREPTDAEL